jgi:hypothetical protein
MTTIDLTDDEMAALTAAVRLLIADDRYPRAPHLAPLRSRVALTNLDPVVRSVDEDRPPSRSPRHLRAARAGGGRGGSRQL